MSRQTDDIGPKINPKNVVEQTIVCVCVGGGGGGEGGWGR